MAKITYDVEKCFRKLVDDYYTIDVNYLRNEVDELDSWFQENQDEYDVIDNNFFLETIEENIHY